VEVPAPDHTIYSYASCRQAAAIPTAVDHARTTSRLAADRRQIASVELLPVQTVEDGYEGVYELVDDDAYLEPSATYRHESRDRRVTWYGHRRRQSYEVVDRLTLPRRTLLLVDGHVTGCDVTRPVLALDRQGRAFYVPQSSLRPFDEPSTQPWYFPTPLSAHQATVFIAAQRQNGCFVVYRPAQEERPAEDRPDYVLAVGLSQG